MADKQQFLDVWIVDTNTVYKQVPFTVVTDWLQQGRLLDSDCVKPSATKDWYHIRDVPGLAAFLPRAERFRAEDKAEALEPVAVDFSWKQGQDDEEDDVDMIPLIDVSLVLLIFFMMTASVAAAARLMAETGATLIHPYDDPAVIAGQGTVALELHEQVPGLDALVAPVSGGGLLSGLAIATAAVRPEAAVVGVPHPKWSERPIAVYVLKPGATASADDLRAHLATKFPKFWLPDAFEPIDAIPRTSAGKFLKTELRARYHTYFSPK